MNITSRLLGTLVVGAALALQAGHAAAQPGYGPLIDEFCTQNDRVPATPYADAVGSVPQQECQFCHGPLTLDPRIDVSEPNFSEFDLARLSGDYSFFCPTPRGSAPNHPPVLAPIGDRTTRPGALLVFQVQATDADGDPLTLSASGLPRNASFTDLGNGSGELNWTPNATQVGTYRVVFTVSDSRTPPGTASEEISLWVGENQPPVLDPVGSQSGRVGVPVRLDLHAVDPDGDHLSFSVSGAPQGAQLTDHGDGTAEWAWLPGDDQAGNYSLGFEVTDDGEPAAVDSEQIVLSIGAVNRPPQLAPIGDRTLDPGAGLVIALSASDPDRNHLAFSVSGAPASALLVDRGDGTAEFSWQPAPTWSGVLDLVFTATDDGVPPLSAWESVAVRGARVNFPPELSPVGDRSARVGEPLVVPLTATDQDGGTLAFAAPGLPAGAELVELGAGRAELRWTPAGDQVGVWPLVVAVADAAGATDSETFQIAVEPPLPPAPRVSVQVLWAAWEPHDARVFAWGRGAAPGETVSLVDVGTGALLGVRRANRRGAFEIHAAPFIAPCGVIARVQGGDSPAFSVLGKPRDCGRRLLTRVHDLEWKCRSSELRIEARRAPASGSLELVDAVTGAALGSAAADHHGRVDVRLALPTAPLAVRLGVSAGASHWDLGTFPVEGARSCGRRR